MPNNSILNLADNKTYSLNEVYDILKEYQENHSFRSVVLMHQLMWSWIYQETKEKGVLVGKPHFFQFLKDNADGGTTIFTPTLNCFLCDYVWHDCIKCPAIWSGVYGSCYDYNGEYERYFDYLKKVYTPSPNLDDKYMELIRAIAVIPMKDQ